MKTKFVADIQGSKATIFSKEAGPGAPDDGAMVNLGSLVFTDSAGDRPDLLKSFLTETGIEVIRA